MREYRKVGKERRLKLWEKVEKDRENYHSKIDKRLKIYKKREDGLKQEKDAEDSKDKLRRILMFKSTMSW